MKKVYKYLVQPGIDVYIPEGAQLLQVAEQFGEIQLWALVDPHKPARASKRLVIHNTGGGDT